MLSNSYFSSFPGLQGSGVGVGVVCDRTHFYSFLLSCSMQILHYRPVHIHILLYCQKSSLNQMRGLGSSLMSNNITDFFLLDFWVFWSKKWSVQISVLRLFFIKINFQAEENVTILVLPKLFSYKFFSCNKLNTLLLARSPSCVPLFGISCEDEMNPYSKFGLNVKTGNSTHTKKA